MPTYTKYFLSKFRATQAGTDEKRGGDPHLQKFEPGVAYVEEKRTELLLSHITFLTDQCVKNVWTMLLHTTTTKQVTLVKRQFFPKMFSSSEFIFCFYVYYYDALTE